MTDTIKNVTCGLKRCASGYLFSHIQVHGEHPYEEKNTYLDHVCIDLGVGKLV